MVLVHKDLIPPDSIRRGTDLETVPWKTEFDVVHALKDLNHEVLVVGVLGDLNEIRAAVETFKPHIIFNLLEEFDGQAVLDQNIVSYLELLKIPYTGCNPRGLMLSRDKALTKKILTFHKIPTPEFKVYPKNLEVRGDVNFDFPMIVKCLNEEASMGISQSSIVHTAEKLMERVQYVHRNFQVDAIAERFVAGSEYYVGVYGNNSTKALPTWQLSFEKVSEPDSQIYSEKAKFNKTYRKKIGVKTGPADLSKAEAQEIQDLAKKTYRALGLNGYARIDFRRDDKGGFFVLESNPNPNIASDDEFAQSAHHSGMDYESLIEKILNLGKAWSKTAA
jgi:D-alanine-D-alanine ligase